jgi:hypothetical protein
MPSWKKVIISGSNAVLNTVSASSFTGSFTGSLFGTASYANNSLSSSYSITSSVATSASYAATASYVVNALTASYVVTAQTASYVLNAVSSSFASTASFLNNTTNAFIQNGNSFGVTALLGTNDNQSLALETSGSTRMFISSSGNVGIDTVSPDVKLSVSPSSDISAKIGYAFIGKGTDAGLSGYAAFGNINMQAANQIALAQDSNGLTILNAASGQSIRFRIANANKAIIDSSGNVGIGTTTPTASLQVENNLFTQVIVKGTETSRTAEVLVVNSADKGFNLNVTGPTYASGIQNSARISPTGTGMTSVSIGTQRSSATASFIVNTSTNRVGINKEIPTEALDVNGNTIITGSLTVITGSNIEFQVLDTGVKIGNIISDIHNVTGSLRISGSITGSLLGTASYASNALSSSYAATASIATSASYAFASTSASYAGTASVLLGSVVSASYAATASYVVNALTASYVVTAQTASYVLNAVSASFASTASLAPNYTTLTSFNSFTSSYRSGSFTGSFTGSLLGTASYATNALSSSYAATASIATSSSYALSASFAPAGNPFPFTGSAVITGSLTVTGSVIVTQNITGSRLFLSSSNGTVSGSTLIVYGSGSAQPVFTVQGSQGELFSITDSLTGSLFSVNDISGLPILEVFSDSTTLIGNYQAPALYTTNKVTSISGSNVIYSLPTASYDGVFVDYTIRSGSNARAGQVMGIWSGSLANYTDNSTTDFGTTVGFIFAVIVSGSNMVVTGSSTTAGWTVKTIIRSI